MHKEGWHTKKGVKLLLCRWQDALPKLQQYDAIFFDTYGEDWSQQRLLHTMLPKLLKKGGVYSFFNGFCPDNIFFQGVACQVVQSELKEIGLESDFLPVDISACFQKKEPPPPAKRIKKESMHAKAAKTTEANKGSPSAEAERQEVASDPKNSKRLKSSPENIPADWDGVKRVYFYDNIYYLPMCTNK